MDAKKCCAYNETRKSLLCAEANVVDAAVDPLRVLKVLIEGLDPDTEKAIYLQRFSGVPVAGTLCAFDLIYLDQNDRVIQGVTLSPDFEARPFRGRAAAALVLPPGTIALTRTAAGDALSVTPVEERVSQAKAAPVASRLDQQAESTDWLSRIRSDDELTPAVADEVAEEAESQSEPASVATAPEQAAERPDSLLPTSSGDEVAPAVAGEAVEEAESEPELAPLATTPEQAEESTESLAPTASDDELILVVPDEMAIEYEPISISAIPEQARESTEFEAEQPLEHGGSAPLLSGDDSGEQQAVFQQLDEKQEAAFQEQEEPLEVQLRRLVAQKLDEKEKAGYPVQKDSFEVELRRLVSQRGSRLKRIRLWTSSVFAKGFSGSPARTKALKASHMGSVEWVGDQPRRTSAAPAPAKQGPQAPARKEPLKIRLLRRIDYFLRWLNYEEDLPQVTEDEDADQRRGGRVPFPDMIAFYWTGGVPKPCKVGNISVSGFYLITDDRWSPGTIIRMTLQRGGAVGDNPRDTIIVFAKVVRWGPDGEGFEFVLTKLLE